MADLLSFRLHELEGAPDVPGVYAWYYTHELSDRDIETCLAEISRSSAEARAEIIHAFLERHLFRYYRETPYSATLSGPLKPRYFGQLEHQPEVSSSLIARIAEDPGRLRSLKSLLKLCIPHFASPIYIGVAASLRTRLLRHKALIEKLINTRDVDLNELEPTDDAEVRIAHSFAREVCVHRRFVTFNLSVYVIECSLDETIRVDVENVLNRINYPLCGRN